MKFSLKHASLQAPSWSESLRQAGFISAAAATAYQLIRGITLVGVIGVVGRGGRGRDVALRLRITLTLVNDGLVSDTRDLVSLTSYGVRSGSGR
jgi:hypothetical protein